MIRFGCCVLGALLACSTVSGAIDRGLVALMPPDTQMVVTINAQEALSSDFGRYLLQDTHWSDTRLRQLMASTGFDPRRDLVTLIIARGRTPSQSQKQNGRLIGLARGSFDARKIGGFVTLQGATVEQVRGVSLYVMKHPGDNGAQGLAFLDTDIAVLGDIDRVRQVLEAHTTPTSLNPQLEELLEKASNNHDVWFALLDPANDISGAIGAEGPSPNARLLQYIVNSTGGIRFASDVEFSVDALARNEKDANSLADVARFGQRWAINA